MPVAAVIELVKASIELAKVGVELGNEVIDFRRKYKAAQEESRRQDERKAARTAAAAELTTAQTQLAPLAGGAPGAKQGVMELPTLGARMEGVFVNDELHGFGMQRTPTSVYHGEFDDGDMHGEGTIWYTARRVRYSGSWVRGVRQGFGQLVTSGGTVYEGTFASGEFQSGKIVTPRGLVFVGKAPGFMPSVGRVEYTTGLVYDGELKGWEWHGAGRLWYPRKNAETGKPFSAVIYEGEFVSAAFHGKGTMKWRSGKSYTGGWEKNELADTPRVFDSFDVAEDPLVVAKPAASVEVQAEEKSVLLGQQQLEALAQRVADWKRTHGGGAAASGQLLRKSPTNRHRWVKLHCVLCRSTRALRCYESEEAAKADATPAASGADALPLATVRRVELATTGKGSDTKCRFNIHGDDAPLMELQASSADDAARWVRALEDALSEPL